MAKGLSLNHIKQPVASDLDRFESHFRATMRSKVPLLDLITYYIVRRKGKQVRPLFVLLCAKAVGKVQDKTFTAASLVELLHTATLVHDDVVDDAHTRRGFFSINALWKNKIAVLVGDYLLSQGLLLAVRDKAYSILEIVSRAVKEMSEGELLQIEKARKLDIEEPIYFEIIRQKTASLIAAACAAGAASTTDDQSKIDLMWSFGEKIGIAFQIRDDLFDYGSEDVGKPLGIDIKEKKMTLPLIYTLNKIDKAKRKEIIRNIKVHHEKPEKVQEIIEFVKSQGGMEYAYEAMIRYEQEAIELLSQLPDSEAKNSLKELVLYVTRRKK